MCGRFTLIVTPEVLAKTFDLSEIPQIEHRYNIAPGQSVACIRKIDGRMSLDFLTWGAASPELTADASTHGIINMCTESLSEQTNFLHAIQYNRCIIPATGFYEWLPRNNDNGLQPYYIRLLNSSVMGFAGLCMMNVTEEGTAIESCCILTTRANELIVPIHDRMPVILQPEDYELWLDGTVHDPQELERLYQEYPPELMFAHPVPNLVNTPRFDSPSCILQM